MPFKACFTELGWLQNWGDYWIRAILEIRFKPYKHLVKSL